MRISIKEAIFIFLIGGLIFSIALLLTIWLPVLSSTRDISAIGETAEILYRIDNMRRIDSWNIRIAQWSRANSVAYSLHATTKNGTSFSFKRNSLDKLLEDLDYLERILNE